MMFLRHRMNTFLPNHRLGSLMMPRGRTLLPDARELLLTETMCQCLITCSGPHLQQNRLRQCQKLLLGKLLTHSDYE